MRIPNGLGVGDILRDSLHVLSGAFVARHACGRGCYAPAVLGLSTCRHNNGGHTDRRLLVAMGHIDRGLHATFQGARWL